MSNKSMQHFVAQHGQLQDESMLQLREDCYQRPQPVAYSHASSETVVGKDYSRRNTAEERPPHLPLEECQEEADYRASGVRTFKNKDINIIRS